ncbi:glycine zipper domain-containing protein [Thermodesulfobacteriota bacterium]
MMKKIILPVLLVLSLLTASCQTTGKKATVGAGIGAASGALLGQAIGRNTEATLIGAAVGGLVGYIIGNEMDKNDRRRLNTVYETGPSGQSAAWTNPDTGNQYQVTPQAAYTHQQTDQVCREAEINATIDGKTEKTNATSCRDNNGNWVVQ